MKVSANGSVEMNSTEYIIGSTKEHKFLLVRYD